MLNVGDREGGWGMDFLLTQVVSSLPPTPCEVALGLKSITIAESYSNV